MASGSSQYEGVNKGRASRAGTGKKSSAKQRKEQRRKAAKDFDNNFGKGGDA
jgi:hypothetical protein